MKENIQHVNPEGLIKNPAFSQVITTQGEGKTVYIGGQNAVNKNGETVGKEDIVQQTEQVMKNIEIALKACNGTFEHLIKLTIHIASGQDALKGFQVSQKFIGHIAHPPVITVLFVSGFVHPDYLLEIDAIAFIPAERT